ncbi:MAG: helix-turn-helix domain-containing protein [Candidatus Tectomicrobia bacterium]|nr:helix-turn-helix domain-containing protein [Candidatus Tectomicrobia bacterium]
MGLVPVPSLDDIAGDPAQVTALSPEAATALLAKLTVAQGALMGRLLALQADGRHAVGGPAEDRLLTVEDAAAKLCVTVDWLYRRTRSLPFVVRQGKFVRFSTLGIERFIRQQQRRA